jgi:hypothetical protein
LDRRLDLRAKTVYFSLRVVQAGSGTHPAFETRDIGVNAAEA